MQIKQQILTCFSRVQFLAAETIVRGPLHQEEHPMTPEEHCNNKVASWNSLPGLRSGQKQEFVKSSLLRPLAHKIPTTQKRGSKSAVGSHLRVHSLCGPAFTEHHSGENPKSPKRVNECQVESNIHAPKTSKNQEPQQ